MPTRRDETLLLPQNAQEALEHTFGRGGLKARRASSEAASPPLGAATYVVYGRSWTRRSEKACLPLLPEALVRRAAYERWAERMGHEALVARHPSAKGFLRPRDGYRLYDEREELTQELQNKLRATEGAHADAHAAT